MQYGYAAVPVAVRWRPQRRRHVFVEPGTDQAQTRRVHLPDVAVLGGRPTHRLSCRLSTRREERDAPREHSGGDDATSCAPAAGRSGGRSGVRGASGERVFVCVAFPS